ncbi:hypothetical protein O181_043747 [Austropuccinia psidii MF-1]|uniref:BRCT domain-containing protein n=1 Tax=Austropuccinia psidii MF-1 TaxID=1389203 RepID=A0A9Q3DQF8_9BASI|nr:hypothetical protein [Austropuccinia psidii MF-1]
MNPKNSNFNTKNSKKSIKTTSKTKSSTSNAARMIKTRSMTCADKNSNVSLNPNLSTNSDKILKSKSKINQTLKTTTTTTASSSIGSSSKSFNESSSSDHPNSNLQDQNAQEQITQAQDQNARVLITQAQDHNAQEKTAQAQDQNQSQNQIEALTCLDPSSSSDPIDQAPSINNPPAAAASNLHVKLKPISNHPISSDLPSAFHPTCSIVPSSSSSKLTESSAITKKKYQGKRLFEDINNPSQDIFSFLDNPSRPNKPIIKPTTRPVFESSQPLFIRNNRIPSDPDLSKRKHRILASNKLLAGSKPQMKKLKPNSPQSALKSKKIKSSNQLISKPNSIKSNLFKSKEINLQSTSTLNSNSDLDSTLSKLSHRESHLESNSNPQTNSSTGTSSLNLPKNLPTASSPPRVPSTCSNLLPSNQLSPVKRAYEPTTIQPVPPLPSSTTSTTTSNLKTHNSDQESSLDDIDFLSPKKKIKSRSLQENTTNHSIITSKPQSIHDQDLNPQTLFHQPAQSSIDFSKDQHFILHHQNQPSQSNFQLSNHLNNHTSTLESDTCQPTKDDDLSSTLSSPLSSPLSSLPESYQSSPSNSSTSQLSPPTEHISVSSSISTIPLIIPTPSQHQTDSIPNNHTQSSSLTSKPSIPQPDGKIFTSPKPSQKIIPIRSSPIKYPTLPTSIPILKTNPFTLSQQSNTTLKSHQPVQPALPSPVANLPKRPSMLPRRALKPSMGTSQPLTFNIIPSLDAIVEASPEKRPVRDALSATSLNRSRGLGLPEKVIFTGGIKAKGAELFSLSETPNPSSLPFITTNLPKPTHQKLVIHTNQNRENQEPLKPQSDLNGPTEDDDLASGDTSNTSLESQRSMTSNLSSSSSNSTHRGNISPDTQERLAKLQSMLTKMSKPDNMTTSKSLSTGLHQVSATYEEYEVPIKDENDRVSSSRARRRSSSVPASSSLSRSISNNSKSSQLSNNNQSSETRGRTQSKLPVQRRVSNILPSALLDFQDDHPSSSTNSLQYPSGRPEKIKKSSPLKDVVAFVDVRTAEGDDAGKIFVEMLKSLGAKVVSRATFPLTHIIFKAGKQATIDRWFLHPRPKPFLVGIGWVVRCREVLSKVNETPYAIDINSSQAPLNLSNAGFDGGLKGVSVCGGGGSGNRRKSMEPKALSLLNSGLQYNHLNNDTRHVLSRSCINKSTTMARNIDPTKLLEESIDRARRKSLQFLPKVGSPLANKVFEL